MTGDIIEHRAEEHDVYAIGVGASGTIYYADLKTLEEITKKADEPAEETPATRKRHRN